jgi:hypothetical protein
VAPVSSFPSYPQMRVLTVPRTSGPWIAKTPDRLKNGQPNQDQPHRRSSLTPTPAPTTHEPLENFLARPCRKFPRFVAQSFHAGCVWFRNFALAAYCLMLNACCPRRPITPLFSNMEIYGGMYTSHNSFVFRYGGTYLCNKSFVFKYGGMAYRGGGPTSRRWYKPGVPLTTDH